MIDQMGQLLHAHGRLLGRALLVLRCAMGLGGNFVWKLDTATTLAFIFRLILAAAAGIRTLLTFRFVGRLLAFGTGIGRRLRGVAGRLRFGFILRLAGAASDGLKWKSLQNEKTEPKKWKMICWDNLSMMGPSSVCQSKANHEIYTDLAWHVCSRNKMFHSFLFWFIGEAQIWSLNPPQGNLLVYYLNPAA